MTRVARETPPGSGNWVVAGEPDPRHPREAPQFECSFCGKVIAKAKDVYLLADRRVACWSCVAKHDLDADHFGSRAYVATVLGIKQPPGGARRRTLSYDERRLLHDIGESGKAVGVWPDAGQAVAADVAARAAEMAYRRGVVQGAYFMLWHLRGSMDYQPGKPGEAFAERLGRWRSRGDRENYSKAEMPPGHVQRHRGEPR